MTQARLSSMKITDSKEVSFVKKKKLFPSKGKTQNKKTEPNKESSNTSGKQCIFCGQAFHLRKDCPASGQSCNNCRKRGHFAVACRIKKYATAREVVDYESEAEYSEEDEDFFLGMVNSSNSMSRTKWERIIEVDSTSVPFKIDTGADVSILPVELYQKKFKHKTLFPSTKILRGPGNTKLHVVGCLKCKLSYKCREINTTLYVIKGSTALLRRDSSLALGIVALIDNVDLHPKLFQGLGKMPEPYKIAMKDNAQPFSVTYPRRMSIPLMPKVRDELKRLQEVKVIRSVTEPTEWCAPIVAVSKPNGQVRICVDFSKLN